MKWIEVRLTAGRFWNQFVGGWTFGLIGELRTGPPFGVIEQVNRTNSFSPASRPNVVGDPKLPGSRPKDEYLARWFDTTAFEAPPLYTFGNAGRMVGYGPGLASFDLSLLKDFHLVEKHRLQFRTEMINFPNHPSFGLPVSARGNAAFGRITSTGSPRVVQFGLHYRF